ncbi:MAG: aminotransferase class V-fold PLP-dependent enzyme [Acidobacteria bacterium]|nr:aminotransferase class V-fold PLP-dependent enzyme [Acidobacteriota bacterium]MBP7475999.1 aminotransferase class V-fold PLP-dependent enzyme [Pyrinomonadaceae bacterium]
MIYLDNNATTQIAPPVFEAMRPFLEGGFGNPSSAYAAGSETRSAVERARESVAGLIGARQPSEIVFTSGGTESDNWAILGSLEATGKNHIVTTRVEHEAVRKLCQRLETRGYAVSWLDVDEEGLLDLEQLRDALTPETAVVSVMMANNETGVLFPVAEIASIVKEHSDALFHVDGVNAIGKISTDLGSTAIDLFSLSAHKFHGPKGVGALYIRDGVSLPSLAIGGGQEIGRRAGTEAVHQIVGLGAAAEFVRDMSPMKLIRDLRDQLETGILQNIPNTRLNGHVEHRLPNTSNISFENTNGEMILARLDGLGVCVSTGSACNAHDHKASAVLEAMNVPYSYSMGSIRFSLGRMNKPDEIDLVLRSVTEILFDLRSLAA